MNKLWSGRFGEATDAMVETFTASISFDRQLIFYDLLGSIAHVKMLAKQNIIASEDRDAILDGLEQIWREAENGTLNCQTSDEDIHMCVERRLIELTGDRGKKLHTARSRNDQVALDVQMFIRDESAAVAQETLALIQTLMAIARNHRESYMPGYTHLQRAQPTTLGHYLLNYAWKFKRNLERVISLHSRSDLFPLGSGAFAGTGIDISRELVAEALHFDHYYENSMDAVSSRDIVWEFMFCLSAIMLDLSRLSEDLIVWSTREFNFIQLHDTFATGSSIMPQKKNPDVPELIRAKTGRTLGNLTALATVLKALPMAYNKDMQEDKEGLFDSLVTTKNSLMIARKMLNSMQVNRNRMQKVLYEDFSNATDLAEQMVMQGVPFREAHALVGKLVAYCEQQDKLLLDLTEKEFKEIMVEASEYTLDFENIQPALDPVNCVKNKCSRGGPAPAALDEQLMTLEKEMSAFQKEIEQMQTLI